MSRAWKYIFFIIIIGPVIISYLWTSRIENTEKRELEERPSFSINTYYDYPEKYENYFNDHSPFRAELISLNNQIMYYAFHDSSARNVILGNDQWLFFRQGELDDYKHSIDLTEADINATIENMQRVKNYFDQKGIEFVVFIAPNKSTIYGEKMPDYIKVADSVSRTEEYISALKGLNIRVVYPKEQLMRGKQLLSQSIYYPLDTHWNEIGGYIGAKALLNELNIDIPDVSRLTIEEISRSKFDLSTMIGIPELAEHEVSYQISGYGEEKIVYSDLSDENNARFKADDTASDKKILFIRDSFMTAMEPVVASQFKEAYMPHIDLFYKPEMLEKEKPDIVVLEIVERSKDYYLQYYDIVPKE